MQTSEEYAKLAELQLKRAYKDQEAADIRDVTCVLQSAQVYATLSQAAAWVEWTEYSRTVYSKIGL